MVYAAQGLVARVWDWQHSPDLTQPRVVTAPPAQVEAFQDAPPADVQVLSALQKQGVEKVTYQAGGLNLVLTYVERIGLTEAVDRRCHRDGEVSEGTVITGLVVNRLLAPCALRKIAKWVEDTGLHLLLGISDPALLNYYRLADALLAIYPHWQEIAAEVTLKAVERFQLAVETVHDRRHAHPAAHPLPTKRPPGHRGPHHAERQQHVGHCPRWWSPLGAGEVDALHP